MNWHGSLFIVSSVVEESAQCQTLLLPDVGTFVEVIYHTQRGSIPCTSHSDLGISLYTGYNVVPLHNGYEVHALYVGVVDHVVVDHHIRS